MDALKAIKAKYQALAGRLDEATLRLWVAAEARSLGRGGVSLVAKAAGVSRTTVYAGLAEIQAAGAVSKKRAAKVVATVLPSHRVRAPGAGRKKLTDLNPALLEALDALVEPTSRGDPTSALRWTCKSTSRLAQELGRQGHRVSQRTVCDLLAQLNYSLQSTRKTREGGQHPDRDAQFQHIAQTVAQ
jgi:transposase